MPLPAHGRRCRSHGRWATLRARAADESGAILVITAIMLVAFIGLAALAIDVGSFYQSQRQAQAAADAGALAGADALAGGASAASATTSATNIAKTNYPSSTVPTAVVNGTSVTVKVASTTPAYFGQIFGVTKENVAARAVASGTAAATNCTTAGANCQAIFAMDSNCTTNHYGITASAGSINITGGVHSNGSIDDSSGGSTWSGPVTNGPAASGCTTNHNVNQETITNGPTAGPVISTWPIDYSVLYPACSGAQCTGPNGTPSYCDVSGPSFTFTSAPTPQTTYCYYGTGNPADPSTYTGAVAFNNGGFDVIGTFIAGTISVNAGINKLLPDTSNNPNNHLIFYAASADTGSGKSYTPAVNYAAGGYPIAGDTFAPNGTIAVTAGINSTSFFEAQDVNLAAGGYTITGDGPTNPNGTTTSGKASLTQ